MLDAAPFVAEVRIADAAVGTVVLTALGVDETGAVASSVGVGLNAVPAATLTALRILEQDPILFDVASTRAVTVFGMFDDDIERNMSNAGTEFVSSDPGIVHVSEQGVMTALDCGVTTIAARHGDLQDSILVTVRDDEDGDGVCGPDDNCAHVANDDQRDTDTDGFGDACDPCAVDAHNDADDDGICGDVDNCPGTANTDQLDGDADAIGDACDACPVDAGNDADVDGICGDVDNCPDTANADQLDGDADAIGDACDACPVDAGNDADVDGICGDVDNCPDTANGDQHDVDVDGLGDACDACPLDGGNDADGDSVCGDVDNCPAASNIGQDDSDEDGLGDVCDSCANDPNNDVDGDSVCGDEDNCPLLSNAQQTDSDADQLGDACDDCPLDADNDADHDGACGDEDNCPLLSNPGQSDADGDYVGDACDACPHDIDNDVDVDSVCGDVDNCPEVANADQADADADGRGDACDRCPDDSDDDVDADGICGDVDNCPTNANVDQADADLDGAGDVCDVAPLASGTSHTCVVSERATVACWGSNVTGQLGNGSTGGMRSTPRNVVGIGGPVRAVTAGAAHTCALLTSGAVQCWGSNVAGQIGDGTIAWTRDANIVDLDSGASAIEAGAAHTCALLDTGAVQCWGANLTGQIGDDTVGWARPTPTTVALGGTARAIAAGGAHTCAILDEDDVWCWGANLAGQLGNGFEGWIEPAPVAVQGLGSNARVLAAGDKHTCVLLETGIVKCWGSDTYGQLGDGVANVRVSAPVEVVGLEEEELRTIATGDRHTCAVLTSGGATCWGADGHGQLGDGDVEAEAGAPVAVVGLHEAAAAIATGGQHTCVLLATGAAMCWGRDDRGQLGNGDGDASQHSPVSVLHGALE